jgi:hypothetical protein
MVALTGEEPAAPEERLTQVAATEGAGGTLSVSANASTSVTFTEAEPRRVLRAQHRAAVCRAARVELLDPWLVNETAGAFEFGEEALTRATCSSSRSTNCAEALQVASAAR